MLADDELILCHVCTFASNPDLVGSAQLQPTRREELAYEILISHSRRLERSLPAGHYIVERDDDPNLDLMTSVTSVRLNKYGDAMQYDAC